MVDGRQSLTFFGVGLSASELIGWDLAEVATFEPLAVAFEVDDLGVVHEPVDHGGCDKSKKSSTITPSAGVNG